MVRWMEGGRVEDEIGSTCCSCCAKTCASLVVIQQLVNDEVGDWMLGDEHTWW